MNQRSLFGQVLREIRIEKGLTQEKFAELLGTSKQVISRYENNQRNPKLKTVEDFAEKLDIPAGNFIRENIEYKELIGALDGLSNDEVKYIVKLIRTMRKSPLKQLDFYKK